MAGIDTLKKIAEDAAQLATAAYRANNSIFNVPGLLGPYRDLKSADYAQAMVELKDLDDSERAELTQTFNLHLDLPEDMKAKVMQSEGYLDRAIELARRGLALAEQAKGVEADAEALANEVKTFLGV